MASTIPKPTAEDYIFADNNPNWLITPSPFDELDDEWYQIIIFYVFHVPVSDVSARAKSLESFVWGSKSKNNDFKQQQRKLIKYGNMSDGSFLCEDGWAKLKVAFQNNGLDNFPSEINQERVTYRKTKAGENDSLLSHIRNSFAHGRLAFYLDNDEVYVAMEDIDDKKHVSARMVISKRTLLRWKTIIESGPFITNDDLESKLSWKE